jgi:hypothetical protein
MNHSNQATMLIEPWMSHSVAMPNPAHQLMALGRERGWSFEILGRAPLPTEPVQFGDDWLIVPAEQDTSSVPARALHRVRAVYEAGIRPRGFLIVHEVPKQLPTPAPERPERLPTKTASHRVQLMRNASGLTPGGVGTALVAAGGTALAIAARVLSASLVAPVLLLAGVFAVIDPILVCVIDDTCESTREHTEELAGPPIWVEIDRWWA